MASDNVEDWDLPLPTPEDESEASEDAATPDEQQKNKNLKKLKGYVEKMVYKPVKPPTVSAYTESLAKANKRSIIENAQQYADCMVPTERGERMKRLASKHKTMTLEQLEQAIRAEKSKERRKENLQKRKQEIYYEMLTKLELQCRTQYLDVVLKKFANFIAKLATTMHIPSNLIDPYDRMQRGIFCNILQALGVQPSSQAAFYYNTQDGSEYEVCHKMSHALLSLIIKALDLAATRNTDNLEPIEMDLKMDDYIKERLMAAAEKKVLGSKRTKRERQSLGGDQGYGIDKKLEQCVNDI